MSPHHYLIPKEALEELEGYDFLLPNSVSTTACVSSASLSGFPSAAST